MSRISKLLPEVVAKPLKSIKRQMKSLYYQGKSRYCPVCQRSSRVFRSFGVVPRDNAECPFCNSLERHRLLWLFVNQKTDLFDGVEKKVMHVAPEHCLETLFKNKLGGSYLTADLFDPRADLKVDITAIDFPDNSFDVIYCSHVLEHVHDDKAAMREFRRVLKPTGWAILLVPIIADETFEDPTITDPEERTREFGQHDHVRRYGPDYIDRLREAGFTVEKTVPTDFLSYDEAVRIGVAENSGDIYFCTK